MEIKSGVEFRNYLLQTKLGDGASGEVWKARDLKQPRSVAVKIMREYLAQSQNPIHRERFTREIAAMKELGTHPNIPAFYDGDENFIHPYFAMQYIGGEGMDTILDTGAIKNISAHNRMDIISQISDALSFAHSAGYIHRDIKPGNIKIIGDDTAFLMDFSVAFAEENTAETQLGIGTPLYMPPEVFPSRAGDIFSLALVCYEILYGIHAVFRPTDRITTAAEAKALMDQRLRDKTWNHPTHSPMLQNLNVDLEAVDRVFEKALSYNADERYQDAQEFSNNLRRAVGLEPINARPRTLIPGQDYADLTLETPVYFSDLAPGNRQPTIFSPEMEAGPGKFRSFVLLVAGAILVAIVLVGIFFLLTEDNAGTGAAIVASSTAITPETVVAIVPAGGQTAPPRPTKAIFLYTRTPVSMESVETGIIITPSATPSLTATLTQTPVVTRTPRPSPTDIPISMNLEENLQELFEIATETEAYRCLRFNELYQHFVEQSAIPDTPYAQYGEQLVGRNSPMTFIYTAFCSSQTEDTVPLTNQTLEDRNDDLIVLIRNIFNQLLGQ